MALPRYVVLGKTRLPVERTYFPVFHGAILKSNEELPWRIWIQEAEEEYEQETLLHEIIHLADKTVARTFGITEMKEEIVEEFGKVLYRILRDSDLWNRQPEPNIDQLELNFGEEVTE